MTQDMGNKIMTRYSNVQHKLIDTVFSENEITARTPLDYGSCPATLRLVLSLLLMVVVGVSGVKAQVTLTTDESNPNYYLIQSYINTGFYMRPNGTNVNTLNILNDNMKWFFLDAGKDNEGTENEIQYYYICRKNGNDTQYMYFSSPNYVGTEASQRIWIILQALVSGSEDNYKFRIAPNTTTGAYNIIPKGTNNNSSLNKQGGNAGNGNVQVGSGTADQGSNWYFIAVNDFEWNPLPECFIVSPDDDNKVYYRIKSQQNPAYFIKPGDTYVQTSNSASDEDKYVNMVWYFKEAGSNGLMPYYYIVHAATGKYLRHCANGDNATELSDHLGTETGDAEKRFQFIVVRGANNKETYENPDGNVSGTSKLGKVFNIVPKMLENSSTYSLSGLTTSGTMGKALKTETDRYNTKTHWAFESTNYANVWSAPEISCDLDGTITITQSGGAAVRYTISNSTTPPANPTSSDELYDDSHKPTAENGFTIIKARAIGGAKQPSNVVTKTIVYNPTIAFATGDETYSGIAKVPIVKVGDTEINNSEYIIAYKKSGVSAEFKDAGDYTIELTDVEGGDYIVYGSTTKEISKASLTATADDMEVTYGSAAPTYTASYTGFVNEETDPGFSTQPEFSCDYTATSDVSESPYTITISGGVAQNYEITSYNSGTLTVTPKAVGLTWSTPTSFDYDGNSHTIAATVTDLVGSDEIGVTVTQSAQEGSSLTNGNAVNAGSYTATASVLTGTKAGNYSLPAVNTQDFTINKIALSVTAKPKTITYGDEPANGGVTYSGFIEGESENTDGMFTGTLSYAYSYSQYGDVGNTYTITPSGLTATNYDITFNNGTLTVNPKEVGLVWSETAFVYNGSEQAPTATATGTVNNDVIGVTVTGAQTNAGDYIATASELTGAKVDNYVLPDANTYAFTIGKKAMTVAADAKTKSYGDPDPELTYTSVGLVEGDELTGALARDEGENAGTYAITQGTLNNSNYTITYTGATFTITPKSLGDDTDPAENITIEITEADAEHVIVKQGGKLLRAGTEGTDYDYSITTTGSASDKYYKVTITGANNYKDSFKATFANVTFGTNDNNHYWGTFVSNSSDGNFAVPSNMEAYIVTSINASAGTVEVVPLDNIPEGEPVLLLSTVNANGFIVKTKNDGTDPTVTNLLKVESSAKSVTTAEIYLLYKGEFVLNAEGTLPAGKIYLSKLGGSSAPARLHIVRSQSTGIDNPQLSTPNSQLSGIWYTLDGRRLSGKPSKKGLYLQNGKKMVVR